MELQGRRNFMLKVHVKLSVPSTPQLTVQYDTHRCVCVAHAVDGWARYERQATRLKYLRTLQARPRGFRAVLARYVGNSRPTSSWENPSGGNRTAFYIRVSCVRAVSLCQVIHITEASCIAALPTHAYLHCSSWTQKIDFSLKSIPRCRNVSKRKPMARVAEPKFFYYYYYLQFESAIGIYIL
jgi:hypothetical protein